MIILSIVLDIYCTPAYRYPYSVALFPYSNIFLIKIWKLVLAHAFSN